MQDKKKKKNKKTYNSGNVIKFNSFKEFERIIDFAIEQKVNDIINEEMMDEFGEEFNLDPMVEMYKALAIKTPISRT